jgi:metal-sulfur cluster biosynthetic enzyme
MSSEIDPVPDPNVEYCAYTDYTKGEDVDGLPATGEGTTGTERDVWDALYDVQDPEMPISIVDLGLIYGVAVDGNHAAIDMTLTYTGCPARDMLRDEIREAVASVSGIESVDLRLVWSPGWSIEMVTDQGKADLREFGLSI